MSYPCQGRLYLPFFVDLRDFGEETEAAFRRALPRSSLELNKPPETCKCQHDEIKTKTMSYQLLNHNKLALSRDKLIETIALLA
jgi:hypothetical protein